MKLLEVTIKPNGEVLLHTKGFAGAECQSATRQLEQILGIRGREQLTAEFHAATAINSLHERQRT